MKKILALLFFLLIVLSSCIQTEQKIILNQDGSGKLILVNVIPINIESELSDNDILSEAREVTARMLTETSGISAWKEVSFKLNPDSTSMTINATAYFDDINALGSSSLLFPIKMIKVNNGLQIDMVRVVENTDDLNGESYQENEEKDREMTEDEIQQKIDEYKTVANRLMGFFELMFAELNIKVSYVFPGKIEKVTGFKTSAPNEISFSFTGGDIVEKAYKEFENDDYIRQQVLKGKDPYSLADNKNTEQNDEYMKKIFGSNEMPSCFISGPLKNQFDYKKELAEALIEWNKIKKEYNIE